jgi:hypothetical protein
MNINDLITNGKLKIDNTKIELNFDRKNLTSLDGIENFPNLESLTCSYNKLKSLRGIEKLTKLRFLHCDDNNLINLYGIENLNKLNTLTYCNNPCSKIYEQLYIYEIQQSILDNKTIKLNENNMNNKKQLLENFILKQGKVMLESKLSKGEIDEASFNAMLGGLKNVASKVADKVSDKTKETGKKISDKVKETGSDIKKSIQSKLTSIGDEVISASEKVKEKTTDVVDKVKETGKKIEKSYNAGKLAEMKKEIESEHIALLKKIEEYNKTAVKAGETKIKLISKFRI